MHLTQQLVYISFEKDLDPGSALWLQPPVRSDDGEIETVSVLRGTLLLLYQCLSRSTILSQKVKAAGKSIHMTLVCVCGENLQTKTLNCVL